MFLFPYISAAVTDKGLDMQFTAEERDCDVAALDTSGGQAPSPHGTFCQLGGNTSREDFLDPFASSPLQKGMRRGMLVSDFCSRH